MPPRVVSLLASATETVAALGCAEWLVGRSHECDFPPSITHLPVLSRPVIDIHASSSEIDRQVKARLHDSLSIYQIHEELLRELRPDVILTQTQCDVCAVSPRDLEQAVCQMLGTPARIVTTQPDGLPDLWEDIREIANALQVAERGEELVASLQLRLAHLARQTSQLPHRPTVACLEWIEPLMAAGNWMPELVSLAGGINLFGEAGKHSPWMTWEALVQANPELLVILPCGFDLPRTRSELGPLREHPAWPNLRAVRQNQVFLADGNQYFNRPGPRVVESGEILAEIFHPDIFSFGYQGRAWERWHQPT